MNVTIKRDSGGIGIWKGNPKDISKPYDLYVTSKNDIKALLEDMGTDSAREVNKGWTVRDVEIDDSWINDIG